MKVFPAWAEYLGLDAVLEGIDCRIHDEPEVYRRIVSSIKSDPLALGALVTTHKMDLLEAARDLFDGLGTYADLLGEVSSLSKRGAELWGYALDPITGGLALEAFIESGYWTGSQAEVCILGAGGSSLALTTYLIQIRSEGDRPSRIVVTNRSPGRLNHMQRVHGRLESSNRPGIPVEYVLAPEPAANDAVIEALPPGSLVVNATGLGKDAPGSPVTDNVRFPEKGLIWEFNYRGELDFLRQARIQAERRSLTIEDGWTYFVHGWTRAIAEVFHADISTGGAGFEALSRIAKEARAS
jgi:shikimate 5-dehydrogenase